MKFYFNASDLEVNYNFIIRQLLIQKVLRKTYEDYLFNFINELNSTVDL